MHHATSDCWPALGARCSLQKLWRMGTIRAEILGILVRTRVEGREEMR